MEGIKLKCPKCQFENPEDSKFCFECGHKFELRCPHCDKALPINVKFCNECGHDLRIPSEIPPKDLSFDEKLTKIQRYLPKGLTEKVLSQKDRIEGERKHVTVMFCDMEGFTQLSERLGPEEAYTVMDQIYEILIHKVHDYEGTVNEFTGDGIMALFGAPIALEDAPQRAIRSAYAIHREMTKFSDKMKQEKENIPALKMRIGIHTGPVVVGTLGNDLRVEFKAVGDTVNLASRMEGLAEPGSTYVTEDTFRITEGLFRFEVLGEHVIKGRADMVKAYRVIAPSTHRTRFDVSAERGLTPFVGRERELELLLDGFERAKTGRGQAFSIMSEAGVGKSRLLYEFRKAVANEDVTFMEGKCLSYSRGVAYHPVIDIVKSNFDVVEGDGDFEIREKLKRGLKVLNTDESSTLPYLLELLSVKDSGVDPISMSPEARKDRIIEAVKRITLKGSEIRPLVVATEDLHWIDKSSEEYHRHLLDSISGARVFLIFTYRPEFVHTWGAKSYHSQVNLNRLSNRESLSMVTYLLGTEEIDRQLEELILEKTEGVPFFIEEFIKSLKDLKIIEKKKTAYHLAKDLQKVTIPSTIQDVIMARVDTLPDGAKELLQMGSVIEREFSYKLIKRVTSLSQEELLHHLSALKDAELLYERGIYPESTYIFKHALTREVVYDSILNKRKKKLHDKIGHAIEDLNKSNIVEQYDVLAEHFSTSENYTKGAEYSKLAGRKAHRAAAFTGAIAYLEKSISCLERLPLTDDVEKKIIDTRTILGLSCGPINYHVKAKEAVEPIVDLAIKHGYSRRLSQIYTILGTYCFVIEADFPKAFKYFDEALKISKELKDIRSLSEVNYWFGFGLTYTCEFERALHHLERALEISSNINILWSISSIKCIIAEFIYNSLGEIDIGYKTSYEALSIANKSGDSYSKTVAHNMYGASCYYKGFFEEAEEHLLNAAISCERMNLFSFGAYTHFCLGDLYFDCGEYYKSKHHNDKALSILQHSQLFPYMANLVKIALSRAQAKEMKKDIDLEMLFDFAIENSVQLIKGLMQRYISEIFLNTNGQGLLEAENWIKRALESDRRSGLKWRLARDYGTYAEIFKKKGENTKAIENLRKAIEIFKECGADGWVEKYEKELIEL
jgi:class 3 adenylate cyclase/tetratricopeptide (TPR) repeat protein